LQRQDEDGTLVLAKGAVDGLLVGSVVEIAAATVLKVVSCF
jgi:hypothetical protein